MAVIFSGCATIFNGSSTMISVRSNVKGAEVSVDESVVGKTPFTGEIDNGKKMLKVHRSGYEDVNITLDSKLNTMFWVGLWVAYTPATTDMISGAAWSYSQTDFYVNLDRVGGDEGTPGNATPSAPGSPWSFRMDCAIKQYAMVNYNLLQSELAAGNGPTLASLVMAVPGDDAQQMLDLAKIMQDAHGDIVAFGEQTASYAQKAF